MAASERVDSGIRGLLDAVVILHILDGVPRFSCALAYHYAVRHYTALSTVYRLSELLQTPH
jgi:hypothetical protein